jgi:hypothetical protein
MTLIVKYISVAIERSPAQVYDYTSNEANLPKWASGLGGSIEKVGEDWVAEAPMGKIKVRFAPKNPFGVLDHDVTLPSGETFANPMRVVANGRGSELVFTLFRQPEMTEQQFEEDAKTIAKDFNELKSLLEEGA